MTKSLIEIMRTDRSHWVGDGFRVRSLFSYNKNAEAVSPFLLFDYAVPNYFEPNNGPPLGVGQHPHRGFETVTIVYDGEVSHRDSNGAGGTIGAGDVQWMTAAGGIIHEEFHSKAYSETGGPFRMVQLWVNLPAKHKMDPPKYQHIQNNDIPLVQFEGGTARIIAGEFGRAKGAASTHTPINIWDVRANASKDVSLDLPEGHNAMIAVLSGHIEIDGQRVDSSEVARLSDDGTTVNISIGADAMLLVLTGEPIKEPVVGRGPFVMNSDDEIEQAFSDFRSGKFGTIAA